MANVQHLLDSYPVARKILKIIGELGAAENIEVYVVGGVVRDLFVNRPLNEIDIMVVGDGIEFAKKLANKMGVKNIVPFPKFSTAKIPSKPIPVEVASARTATSSTESSTPFSPAVRCPVSSTPPSWPATRSCT